MTRVSRLFTVAIIATTVWSGGTAAGAVTHDVDVGPGTAFAPADLVIEVGDTVRWTWISGLHNVESGVGGAHDGIFRSGDPTSVAGTTFEVLFDQTFLTNNAVTDNLYNYYCAVHFSFGMTGSVQVVTCPGDIYEDGNIDIGDLGEMLANYGITSGATYWQGDIYPSGGDGAIDISDLGKLLVIYGTSCN
jgi:plastocyanin